MNISEQTAKIISEIKKFSAGKLKNEQDVSILIEASSASSKQKLFEDMIFTAKYLNGLGKILHSNRMTSLKTNEDKEKMSENAEEKIKNEFRQNMIKLNSQITDLLESIPADDKKYFNEKYQSLNRTSLVNLTNLIYDLSWVKKYLNSKTEN